MVPVMFQMPKMPLVVRRKPRGYYPTRINIPEMPPSHHSAHIGVIRHGIVHR